MKFYNIKLRINGSLLHEVIRQKVPAAEVMLLNALHGGNAVVSVTEAGEKAFSPRDHRTERRRLEDKYGQGGQKRSAIEVIRSLFGSVAGALPESIDMEDLKPEPEEVEDLDAPLPAAPVAAAAPEPEDPKAALYRSIEALGGTAPKNASVNRLRDILGQLQIKEGFRSADLDKPEPDSEEAENEASVL